MEQTDTSQLVFNFIFIVGVLNSCQSYPMNGHGSRQDFIFQIGTENHNGFPKMFPERNSDTCPIIRDYGDCGRGESCHKGNSTQVELWWYPKIIDPRSFMTIYLNYKLGIISKISGVVKNADLNIREIKRLDFTIWSIKKTSVYGEQDALFASPSIVGTYKAPSMCEVHNTKFEVHENRISAMSVTNATAALDVYIYHEGKPLFTIIQEATCEQLQQSLADRPYHITCPLQEGFPVKIQWPIERLKQLPTGNFTIVATMENEEHKTFLCVKVSFEIRRN